MKINKYFIVVTILFILLSLVCSSISNFTSVIYLIVCFPFLMYRYLNLLFTSSVYLKKNHFEFYERNKSSNNFVDGKIVPLIAIPNFVIDRLKDDKVRNYKMEIQNNIKLIAMTIVFFILFCLLSIYNK